MSPELNNKIIKGVFSVLLILLLATTATLLELFPRLENTGNLVAVLLGIFAYDPARSLVSKFEKKFLKEEANEKEEEA